MLSEKQKKFITYWEASRERENTFSRKLTAGLPMAAIFGLPILLFVGVVYLYFPDWYARISGTSAGSFIVVVIAVFIAIIFFAYFRMHFKWEMNEQLYTELKTRSEKSDSADIN